MHTSIRDWLSNVSKSLPYAVIIVVGLGIIVTIVLGYYSLAIRASYLIFPAILIFILATRTALISKTVDTTTARLNLSYHACITLTLIFVILFVGSLYLLISNATRPPLYFCLIALMAGIVFVEILAIGAEHNKWRSVILIQICLLSLNLILGQTLTVFLYFGNTDPMIHMKMVDSIIESSRVTEALEYYEDSPLFHILTAIGIIVTGMEHYIFYLLFSSLYFVIISITIIYLLAAQATQDIHLPLVAALLFALSSQLLYVGMGMDPKGMCFLLFILALYLLIKGKYNLSFKIVVIFLILPMILTHQTTLVYVSAILVALLVIEILVTRRAGYIGYIYPTIFIIAYLSYWMYVSYFIFKSFTETFARAFEPLTIPSETVLEQSLLPSLASQVDLSIIAVLAIIGICSLLLRSNRVPTLGVIFALASIPALLFYLQTPLYLLTFLILSGRLAVLVAPFVIFSAAEGLLAFSPQPSPNREHVGISASLVTSIIIVLLLCSSAIVVLGNSTDQNLKGILPSKNREYFTRSEITAFTFCSEYNGDYAIYTDWASWRYLYKVLNLPKGGSDLALALDIDAIPEGYLLLRYGEINTRSQIRFTERSDANITRTVLYKPTNNLSLDAMWGQENKVYDCSSVDIFYKSINE